MGKALEGLDGAEKAEVSFGKKEAVVYFEEGKTSFQAMLHAVNQVGFRATRKEPDK